MLPEVLIRLKHGVKFNVAGDEWRAIHSHKMAKEGKHCITDSSQRWVVCQAQRLNSIKAGEGTFLEADEACAVGRASFREQNQRRVFALLGDLLPFIDKWQQAFPLILVGSIEE